MEDTPLLLEPSRLRLRHSEADLDPHSHFVCALLELLEGGQTLATIKCAATRKKAREPPGPARATSRSGGGCGSFLPFFLPGELLCFLFF